MREVISTCPVCEHELSVTRLHCRECGTTLEGEFSVGRFSRLTRDQMRVLESFLRSRGNLREMERDLGLSYPTVRSRVDALVRSLGYVPFDARGADADGPGADPAVTTERRRILESLARHEIDAEAAAAALRRLTSSPSSPAVVETAASATADPPSTDTTSSDADTVDEAVDVAVPATTDAAITAADPADPADPAERPADTTGAPTDSSEES